MNELHNQLNDLETKIQTTNDIEHLCRQLNAPEKKLVKSMGAKVIELAKQNDPNAVDFLKEQGYEVNNIIMKDAPF